MARKAEPPVELSSGESDVGHRFSNRSVGSSAARPWVIDDEELQPAAFQGYDSLRFSSVSSHRQGTSLSASTRNPAPQQKRTNLSTAQYSLLRFPARQTETGNVLVSRQPSLRPPPISKSSPQPQPVVSKNSMNFPFTEKAVSLLEKCTRCREDQEDCSGTRPRCYTCQRQGFRCVYSFDHDARLNNIIHGVDPRNRKPASETPSEGPEYDYSSHDDLSVSSSSLGTHPFGPSESEYEPEPEQSPEPNTRSLEQILLDYLGEAGSGNESSAPSERSHGPGTGIPVTDIESLFTNMRAEVNAFQAATLRAALRTSKLRCQEAQRDAARPKGGSPFARMNPLDGSSKIVLYTKARGSTDWQTLSAPVTTCKSDVVSLPKSKTIGRLGPSILSRNTRIGKYHPYQQDDEKEADAAVSAKYQEVRQRYHDYSSISGSWAGQRACVEIVDHLAQFVRNLLPKIRVTPADVVYYFLQDASEIKAEFDDLGQDVLNTEQVLSAQKAHCNTCHISPQQDARDRKLQLHQDCPVPSAQTIRNAAWAAHFFHIHYNVSLWHIVSLNTSDARLVSTEDRRDKEEAEQLCLVCGLHSCLAHGAFVEEQQLDDRQGPDEDETGPVRLNDAETNLNSTWQVSTWATPLCPDQHVCGLWCEGDRVGTDLANFRGRQPDGSISGVVNQNVKNTSAYVAQDKLCSEFCFWDVAARVDVLPILTPEEHEIFNSAIKNYSMNERGPCMMHEWLRERKCSEIFALMVDRIRQVPHPSSLDTPPLRKVAKAKLNSKLDLSMDYKIAERRMFVPCDHEGPCTAEAKCECAVLKISCEAHCKCEDWCERRFAGCNCRMGAGQVCGDKWSCACLRAGRECDPSLCKGCGVETVLHQAYKYKPEMRIGRCNNNRIQLELPARTIQAPSEVQGYGLFAGEDLKRGDFIHEYKGEIISEAESNRRGAMYSLSGQEYLFTLNMEQQIDANNFGNKARFMNNSLDDANINVEGRTALCRGQHRVGFFAKKDIKAGEELLYNYEYPKEVTDHFWERGHEREKVMLKTPALAGALARASRSTKSRAKRGKGKKTQQQVRDMKVQSPLAAQKRVGMKGKGVLQSESSTVQSREVVEDFDPMEIDGVAQEADTMDSDYEAEDDAASESEDEEVDEVPESDIVSEDDEPFPVRKGSRGGGRGRGSRGRAVRGSGPH